MSILDQFRKLYDFYTSDLSYKEIEKLIKRDVPELYGFYVNKMKQPEKPRKSLKGLIIFAKNLFIEFLLQLTPVRRLIYTVAVFLFIYGFMAVNYQWSVFAFIIINLLLAFELADKLIAKDELAVARDIQNNLMPKVPPVNSCYDISCCYQAAHEVGGDYYDFIINEATPDKTFVVIGDISGKGMAAAIHMVQVQAILHYIVAHNESPRTILSMLNKNLQKILKRGSFFTVSLALIENDGSIVLSRAGHMPLIHYQACSGECKNIVPKGMGIGLSHDSIFENSLEEINVTPNKGDILVFYTDGIVEAMNVYLQEYGENRFKEIITRNSQMPARDIQEAILDNISYFTENSPVHDDLTMIVMKAV